MTVFTIQSVSEPKEWQGSYGPMLSYKLDLENGGAVDRGVELNRKPESRAPQVGEQLAGHLEPGKFGDKLKIDFEATKELGGSRPSGGSSEARSGSKGNWQPESQRDPERAARILRQHSQEMALRYCALLGDRVPLDQIFRIANQFDADVIGQTSNPTQDLAGQGDTSPPPAPPASDSGSAEHQEICEALDTAGLLYPAAKDFVADYMLSELPPERIKKAVGNLVGQDLELQAQTLSALRASAEQWSGKLVPVPDDPEQVGDGIPF